ncbi:hypothetical protein KUTeg_021205 [Tegillarca granosa]|uniref:C-type lectin domain-containing protein n=1 Tax=Tegillarca granosa TaxID=220873 RepID=A0ABQ9EG33_TEGGR|nr:hypothetical protein KUTeg_021205 [Tegillarca granosa]
MLSTDPSTGNVGYWIGGSDMEVEGEWRWMKSRQPFQFTAWAPGQPDDANKHEDCLHLYGVSGFKWNDYPCSIKGYFICEKPHSPEQTEILG